jgi:hypothetical protein
MPQLDRPRFRHDQIPFAMLGQHVLETSVLDRRSDLRSQSPTSAVMQMVYVNFRPGVFCHAENNA